MTWRFGGFAAVLCLAIGLSGCGGGSKRRRRAGDRRVRLAHRARTPRSGSPRRTGVELALEELDGAQKGGKIGGLPRAVRRRGRPGQGPRKRRRRFRSSSTRTASSRCSARWRRPAVVAGGADLPAERRADDLALLDEPQGHQVGDYIFRMCFIDPFQGTVMAQVRRAEPGSQAGRDPQGRQERLQRRPRRSTSRRRSRGWAARSSPSRPTVPATRTSAPSSRRIKAQEARRRSSCPATTPRLG